LKEARFLNNLEGQKAPSASPEVLKGGGGGRRKIHWGFSFTSVVATSPKGKSPGPIGRKKKIMKF